MKYVLPGEEKRARNLSVLLHLLFTFLVIGWFAGGVVYSLLR